MIIIKNGLLGCLLCTLIFSCASKGDEKTISGGKDFKFAHVWFVDAFKDRQFGSKRHESASPVIVGEDLFQGVSDSDMVVVDKTLGSVKRVIKDSGGMESAPLYYQGVLYFGNNEGEVKAFSYRTGDYLWSYKTGFPVYSAPCVSDGRLFVLGSNDVLYALDMVSGKVLWTFKKDFPVSRPVIKWSSSPVCSDDTVYVGFSDGTFSAVNMSSGTAVMEKRFTSRTKFKDVDATPYVDDRYIIVPSYDGNLYCLNKKTGSEVWSVKDGGAKAVSVEGDTVYFSSDEGYLYSININSGSVKWGTKIKDGIPTSPTVMGDYLIVGSSERGVMFYEKQNGRYAGEFNSGTGVFSDPVVDGDMIYFLSNYGVLYTLQKL